VTIQEMSKQDFRDLPERAWQKDIGPFDSIVILPGRSTEIHESGWRVIDFVAVKNDMAMCRLSAYSDIMHLNGIGGFGKDWLEKYGKCPDSTPVYAWDMDCLKKSGLLRMRCAGKKLFAGEGLSSFDLFAEKIE